LKLKTGIFSRNILKAAMKKTGKFNSRAVVPGIV
jgi:hypothetical protein